MHCVRGDHTLCKVSCVSGAVTPFGSGGLLTSKKFNGPTALAMAARGGSDGSVELVVLEVENSRFQVFRA